ncbi:MAG: hypothetical protein AB1486_09910 [Planctomycetota bacterium]
MFAKHRIRFFGWFILVAFGVDSVALAASVTVGEKLPDVRFTQMLNGDGRMALSQFRGQPVLIQWWDDCPLCLGAIDKIDKLHREYGPKGLVVILMEGGKSDLQSAASVLMREHPQCEARLTTAHSVPVRFTDNGWSPKCVVLGVDGTVLAAAGNHNLGNKIEKLLREELAKAKRGWGSHAKVREARALLHGKGDLAGARRLLDELNADSSAAKGTAPKEIAPTEIAEVRGELEARLAARKLAVNHLLETGRWAQAREEARAFAEAVAGLKDHEAAATSLLALFDSDEAALELSLEKKLAGILKVLHESGASTATGRKLSRFAEETRGTKVGERAHYLAALVEQAAKE